ncbi:hypothetical protein GCK72_006478 [Caenorhabditis remanei]|uniref:F-box associated domain-containing protein n=1 Tax=Caenorhabditis remanei TaxID=31234 RepID=A0A6A5HHG9_CAERE|nr:hypothetical protein GCK72_006478 [Caenorhabditis remanei]KAF1766521.1 hypothetical protein GCK72_006478 [Caenorhabditis remanei]
MYTPKEIDVDIMPKNGDPRLHLEQIISVIPRKRKWKKFVQIEIGGNVMKFRQQTTKDKLVAVYDRKSQMEPFLNVIYTHVCNLFGDDVEYRMLHALCNKDQPKPIYENIKISRIWVWNRDVREIDEHFSSLPKQKFIQLHMGTMTGRLREDSKIFESEVVDVKDVESPIALVIDVLRHFNGQQAILRTEYVDVSEIFQFMNRWKSNQSYQNLMTLEYTWKTPFFDLDALMESAEIKHTKSEVDPPVYTYDERVYLQEQDVFFYEFHSRSYIVREFDRKVASVYISNHRFVFGVWNMTEEEFLDKYSE